MKKLKGIFVRHGLSTANVDGMLVGNTDVDLADEGRQALLEIKDTVDFPDTDMYITSDMRRAMETARILFGDKDFIAKSGFRELNFGDWEGNYFADVDIKQIFKDWYRGGEMKGGEDYDVFNCRVRAAIDDTLAEMARGDFSSFTLVSHSCTMRAIRAYFDDVDSEHFIEFKPKNGSIYIADIVYDEKNNKIIEVDFKEFL